MVKIINKCQSCDKVLRGEINKSGYCTICQGKINGYIRNLIKREIVNIKKKSKVKFLKDMEEVTRITYVEIDKVLNRHSNKMFKLATNNLWILFENKFQSKTKNG